jgi:Receptor L domain
VCESIFIRNSVRWFQQLAGCTVIEGHLRIMIEGGTEEQFRNLTFPKLREITDYLLLLRVDGLKTVSQLFPNLALIRGDNLFHNYAFVVFELESLENIGLDKLMRISRGGIR